MTSIINRCSRPLLTSFLNSSPKHLFSSHFRCNSSHHHRPMMLMDLPRIVYPNLFLTIKNFFSRLLINGFDDLEGFVTQEVINEVKRNYVNLSSEQKQKIPIELSEIVFSYPYLIGFIMDEQANSRLVEITMIFHVLKDRESYREAILRDSSGIATNWTTAMKKMRDNIVVCNYKFLRDMSKNAKDDSWVISGLNHWLPIEYEEQQMQQQ